jgi:hypothetical protein
MSEAIDGFLAMTLFIAQQSPIKTPLESESIAPTMTGQLLPEKVPF